MGPSQSWPLDDVCSHLHSPAHLFSRRGMTITRYQGLIKVDDWHEHHFKGAINQQAQAHSSLQLSDKGLHRHSPLKDRRSHLTGGEGEWKNKGADLTPCHFNVSLTPTTKTPTGTCVLTVGPKSTAHFYQATSTNTRGCRHSGGKGGRSHHVPGRMKVWTTEASHYHHQGVKTLIVCPPAYKEQLKCFSPSSEQLNWNCVPLAHHCIVLMSASLTLRFDLCLSEANIFHHMELMHD